MYIIFCSWNPLSYTQRSIFKCLNPFICRRLKIPVVVDTNWWCCLPLIRRKKKSNQAQSPLCSVVWIPALKIFLTKIHRYTVKYILWKHTILSLRTYMKIPQLRCWFKRMNKKIWMEKLYIYVPRHLIFLNVVSVAIHEFALCGRNANWYRIHLPTYIDSINIKSGDLLTGFFC